MIGGPIAAYATHPSGNNSPPDVVGSQGSSESATPTAVATPTGAGTPTETPLADVRNATLDLPAFPGLESQCKAKGKKTFVNGTVTPGQGVTLTIGAMAPIMANLDGLPGDEELTTLTCQTNASVHVTQLLALKVSLDGALTPLGYVVNSPDTANVTANFSRESITIASGTVRLTVYGVYQGDGWPPCDKQIRGYAFRNGGFRQVSGPTSFVKPSTNFHVVDFRNTGLLVGVKTASGGSVYCAPMANGTADVAMYNDGDPQAGTTHYTVMIGPVSFVNADDGEAAFAILTRSSSGGAAWQTLQSFQHDGDFPLGWEVLRSGVNGVTRIDNAEVAGNTVRVTVTTASGRQTWTYQPSATNQTWQRIS